MKYKFDLLPLEYKSFPRDMLGMVLAVIALVVSVSAISTMYLRNRSELFAVQTQVNNADTKLRAKIDQISNTQPPISEINSLKNSITFINSNLDTPGSSLVDFLANLEAAVPDRVVIKDLAPKNMNSLNQKFVLTGEAPTIFDVLEFAQRLEQSGKFSAMLKTTANATQEESSVQKFTMDFTYKLPAK